MEIWFVIIAAVLLIRSMIWVTDKASKAKLYTRLRSKLDDLEVREARFRQEQLEKLKSLKG